MDRLFRSEATRHAARRLEGEVMLATPLPTGLLVLAAVLTAGALLGFLTLASYARTEPAPGWITAQGGLTPVLAPAAGVVDLSGLQEGAQASAGASLAGLTPTAAAGGAAIAVPSPITGQVVAIPAGQGQRVAAGAALAMVLPSGGRLIAELYAPADSAGSIQPGQRVALSIAGLPPGQFGLANATVVSVAHTLLGPGDVSGPRPALRAPSFRVRAALDQPYMQGPGGRIYLQPGMTLTAGIVTRRRRLIAWLFDPAGALGGRVR